jgi:glycosyltransferase involved in cell wall biosynthesis
MTVGNKLNVALMGTRGIPANYGGFETFAEELSCRLVERGHRVTVYGRSHFVDPRLKSYRGVQIRSLPCVKTKYLETVSHTLVTTLLGLFQPYDVVLMCNAANAAFCWIPKLAGQKVVLNVDGIERLRKKWSPIGKSYYRLSEFLSTVLADCMVTDARSVQSYYLEEYGARFPFIPYGAPVEKSLERDELDKLGVTPHNYLLYVSRLEPENNAHLVIQAYIDSGVQYPLIVVGDAPYGKRYIKQLKRLSEGNKVVLTGAIFGRGYRQLLSHSLCYLHATEVGGTHPALIEAMGAGSLVLVNETAENREVVGEAGLFCSFNDQPALARLIGQVCAEPNQYRDYQERAEQRVRDCYNWKDVVNQYEAIFYQLVGD